jgi:hypothetical protein
MHVYHTRVARGLRDDFGVCLSAGHSVVIGLQATFEAAAQRCNLADPDDYIGASAHRCPEACDARSHVP